MFAGARQHRKHTMQQKDDSAGPFEGLMQDYETRRAQAACVLARSVRATRSAPWVC